MLSRPGFDHAVANDVFDEDGNEGLHRRVNELLGSLLTPPFDLRGPLLVAESLVTGQLVGDVGRGSRNRWAAGRRGVGGDSCLFQRLSGNLSRGVWPDDVQCDVPTVLADQDDTGRLVAAEAEEFDRLTGDLCQRR